MRVGNGQAKQGFVRLYAENVAGIRELSEELGQTITQPQGGDEHQSPRLKRELFHPADGCSPRIPGGIEGLASIGNCLPGPGIDQVGLGIGHCLGNTYS
jgi:hypothetical protein